MRTPLHVAHDVLRRQAEGDSCHPGRGQQRSEIDSHGIQSLHADNGADDGQACGANHAGQRLDLGDVARVGSVLLGDADHPRRGQTEQTAENKADQRHYQQVRQPVAGEPLGIDGPPVDHTAQEPFFRKHARSCRQQRYE
jgi:hypothetical protein